MATIDLGCPSDFGKAMRDAVRAFDKMKVCGSCEFRYNGMDGEMHCAKDKDETAKFAGNVCEEYVFINDWEVRKNG